MHRISEAARTVDVVHETDVLVVGSGPGGLSAALAALAARAQVPRPRSSTGMAPGSTSPSPMVVQPVASIVVDVVMSALALDVPRAPAAAGYSPADC